MTRVVLGSNSSWVGSGYGTQTRILVNELRKLGHEVGVYAFYGLEGGTIDMDGVPIFPKHVNPHGLDIAHLHCKHFGADIYLNLYDPRAWLMVPDKGESVFSQMRWVPWAPIDCEPMSPQDRELLARFSFRTITMSRFGERMAQNAGLDVAYVPHSIDTKVYSPGSKAEAREILGWPKDRYIVGMVAANKGVPSRKNFFEQISAFAKLKRKHPDAMLYLHTLLGTDYDGMHLPSLIESPQIGLKFGTDVFAADPYRIAAGMYSSEDMVLMFRAMDVLTNVSRGEGFGLPILEAQACGTPVIVGDWTSMGELCFGGWKIPKDKAQITWEPINAHQWLPRIQAVYEAMMMAYNAKDSDRVQSLARQGALGYDVDLVTERYWKPTLDGIAQRITEQVEGRAMRVAAPLRRAA